MSSELLVIIPAYNEEDSLKNTIEELLSVIPSVDYIVVNDGSRDSTQVICEENGYAHINLPVNSGLASAFRTGMKYALRHDYKYVVQFDADGQHTPESLEKMIRVMKQGYTDIVIGSRYVSEKKDRSLRMIGSRIISYLIRITTGQSISDPTSGLRMFNSSMIRRFVDDPILSPEPESIAYLLRQGARVSEVQVSMRDRVAGESYLNLSKSILYMVRACASIIFFQWFRR